MGAEQAHHVRWLADIEGQLSNARHLTEERRQEMIVRCHAVLQENPESEVARNLLIRINAQSSQVFEVLSPSMPPLPAALQIVKKKERIDLDPTLHALFREFLKPDGDEKLKIELLGFLGRNAEQCISQDQFFITRWMLQGSQVPHWSEQVDRDQLHCDAEEYIQDEHSPCAQMVAALFLLDPNQDQPEQQRIVAIALGCLQSDASDPMTRYVARKIVCLFSGDYEAVVHVLEELDTANPNEYVFHANCTLAKASAFDIDSICILGLRKIEQSEIQEPIKASFCGNGLQRILSELGEECAGALAEYLEEKDVVGSEMSGVLDDINSQGPQEEDPVDDNPLWIDMRERLILFEKFFDILANTTEWQIQTRAMIAIAHFLYGFRQYKGALESVENALEDDCPADDNTLRPQLLQLRENILVRLAELEEEEDWDDENDEDWSSGEGAA